MSYQPMSGRGRGAAGRNKELRRLAQESRAARSSILVLEHPLDRFPPGSNPRKITNMNLINPQMSSLNVNEETEKPVLNHDCKQNELTNRHTTQYSMKEYDDQEVYADDNTQSVLIIDEKYSNLIEQVAHISPDDDGIVMNQKLQHVEGVITKMCTQISQFRSAVEAIASAAISDATMAKKISKLISFSRMILFQQKLHHVFICSVRDKIEGLEISLDGSDQYLVNSSTLLTDIYTESKLLDIDDITTLIHLIIQVFFGLLECNTTLALRTLNVQTMLHGKDLYPVAPEKFDNISLSVRKMIIARQAPLPSCRIWLALLADQCLYRFLPLPQYLQDFYARHLDDTNNDLEPRDSCFSNELPSSSSDNYSSKLPKTLSEQKVNVVHRNQEKRHSIKSDSSDRWSLVSNGERYTGKNSSKEEVFETNSVNDCLENSAYSEYYSSDINDSSNMNGQVFQERRPRPILGTGSRMHSQKVEMNHICERIPASMCENAKDTPKFCSAPPNIICKNSGSDTKGIENTCINMTSISQESADFWSYPPPKLPPSNLNKRLDTNSNLSSTRLNGLDLNTWRELLLQRIGDADVNTDKSISQDSLKKTASSENKVDENKVVYKNESYVFQNDKKKRENLKNEDMKNWIKNPQNINSELKQENSLYWEKKKFEENSEQLRNLSKQSNEKKINDFSKKDSRIKKEIEDKDYHRQKDLDEKNDNEKKNVSRSSNRTSNRNAKRDIMEVSRKASYWTHDDRCDRDYDE